jgi:hypothetical protein
VLSETFCEDHSERIDTIPTHINSKVRKRGKNIRKDKKRRKYKER